MKELMNVKNIVTIQLEAIFVTALDLAIDYTVMATLVKVSQLNTMITTLTLKHVHIIIFCRCQ